MGKVKKNKVKYIVLLAIVVVASLSFFLSWAVFKLLPILSPILLRC